MPSRHVKWLDMPLVLHQHYTEIFRVSYSNLFSHILNFGKLSACAKCVYRVLLHIAQLPGNKAINYAH